MAFRTNRVRRYRRSRALSARRIYTRTSARAQAGQIMALKRKINRVSRNLRKEVQIKTVDDYSKTFTNSALSSVWDTIEMPVDFMVGEWCRLKSFSLRGIIEYGDNRTAYPGVDFTRSGSVRIIVYQILESSNSGRPASALVDVQASGTGYELNTTRPLKPGTSSIVRVLCDKRYNVSDQQPQKMIKLSFNKLLALHRRQTDSNPRGQLFVGIFTSGLHWTTGGYTEQITVSLAPKIAYYED